nr:ribonuclease H-like domain-containing protein [Tanacetum cinerariifolium]
MGRATTRIPMGHRVLSPSHNYTKVDHNLIDQPFVQLSGSIFGFLEEDTTILSSPESDIYSDIQLEVEEDDENETPEKIEDNIRFWETQHQNLHSTLCRTTSLESNIRSTTKEVLKEVEESENVCSCSRPVSDGCRSCRMREVCLRLQKSGYNSAICKSKWKSSLDIPSGEVRVIIELEFRGQFEMKKGSEEYNGLVSKLPDVFVGKIERLQSVIKILSNAAKKCMKEKKMHLGPWRKQRYVEAKWLRVVERTTSMPLIKPLLVDSYSTHPPRTKARASMLTMDLLDTLPMMTTNYFVPAVEDYQTGRLLLRCDSTEDLHPVTQQPTSQTPVVLLSFSSTTWHRRLGHPGDDVLHRLESKNLMSYRKSKLSALCHACQLGSDIGYLLLYVDDIILTASSSVFLKRIIGSLHSEFAMTDLGSLNYFLESKLGSYGDLVSDSTLYRSFAGAFQYLTFTRPDLSYAVQQVCLYMHDPRDSYFTTLKRIIRYVRGTLDYGLQLHVSSTTQLSAYTDADWAGCHVTLRSTSGYCVFLGDNLLSWSAKRHVTLSRSSAEAEYRGVVNVVAKTAWIRNLLCKLHTPLFTATLVYCDHVSAVYMSANSVQHQRTKHIEIDIHFVRDFVASGQVRVLHVPSRFQYADIFTKGLPTALFIEFRSSLNV